MTPEFLKEYTRLRDANQLNMRILFSRPRSTTEFLILDVIGKGGFGVVYRAHNLLDGVQYALKKIRLTPNELLESSENYARLRREILALARLGEHPNGLLCARLVAST